jgi:hypothetical protein
VRQDLVSRNIIAHQGMSVGFPDASGNVDVSLEPPSLKLKLKKDSEGNHEIVSAGCPFRKSYPNILVM